MEISGITPPAASAIGSQTVSPVMTVTNHSTASQTLTAAQTALGGTAFSSTGTKGTMPTIAASGGTGTVTFTNAVIANSAGTKTVTGTAANGATATAPNFSKNVTVTANQAPGAPTGLAQFKSDGTTSIATGGLTNETTVVLKGTVSDPDGGDNVKLQVEVEPVGTAFTNTATAESGLLASGSIASVAIAGLSDGTSYHWQARTVDNHGNASAWLSFGGNAESAADFMVDTTKPNVTINQAGSQADPTIGTTIHFTAVFNEPVTGFTGSDVSFTGSTAGGTLSAAVSQIAPNDGTTYDVTVTGMTSRGTVVASIPAGGASDAAGNTNNASTSTDNSVTFDRVPATTAPTFSPTSPKTNDLLTASTTTSDPDGDNISVAWTWKVNRGGDICTIQTNSSAAAAAGVRTASLDLSANYVPTSCTGATINPLNPSKGDSVVVEVTPNDGLFNGTLQSSNVTIANTAPTVTLSGANNLTPNEGATNTYNYSISDPDGDTIASAATSCGTGSKTNASNTNTSGQFDCTFADGPASTSVSAQATDSGFGATAGNNATQSISVQNVAPTIAITGNASVNEGSSYSLTLGAVTDPGQDTVSSYVVHWGDGNTSTFSSNGAKTHTYADGPNDYNITVDLVDEDGTFLNRANALSVHVNNVAPTIAISSNASVNEGSSYSLTLGAVTDPGQDTVSSYIVHWGDGNSDTYSTNGAKTHTYADGPNDYNRSPSTWSTRTAPSPTPPTPSRSRQQRRADDRDQRQRERQRGLELQPHPRRRHRPRPGHGLELRRPLGRRQQRHLLHQRREDAHLRRRPQRLQRHRRPGRRRRHLPRRRQPVLRPRQQRRAVGHVHDRAGDRRRGLDQDLRLLGH